MNCGKTEQVRLAAEECLVFWKYVVQFPIPVFIAVFVILPRPVLAVRMNVLWVPV
jgi:hypothetical protein